MLVQACFHGDPDEVRALLYKKEDVNYQVHTRQLLKDIFFVMAIPYLSVTQQMSRSITAARLFVQEKYCMQ